jgi:hypothetical protein
MIFKPELAKKIAAGSKTMTRRPVKDGETQCRYRAGRVYGVQLGRGKPTSFPITITETRRAPVAEITFKEARREGFRTREEFIAYWTELYGDFNPDQEVWVISFVKGDATDRPHLLAARSGTSMGDYTDNPSRAMKGEPEAVSGRVAERYGKRATEARGLQLSAQRERLLEVVADLRASSANASTRKRLRSVEHHVRAIERERIAAA